MEKTITTMAEKGEVDDALVLLLQVCASGSLSLSFSLCVCLFFYPFVPVDRFTQRPVNNPRYDAVHAVPGLEMLFKISSLLCEKMMGMLVARASEDQERLLERYAIVQSVDGHSLFFGDRNGARVHPRKVRHDLIGKKTPQVGEGNQLLALPPRWPS